MALTLTLQNISTAGDKVTLTTNSVASPSGPLTWPTYTDYLIYKLNIQINHDGVGASYPIEDLRLRFFFYTHFGEFYTTSAISNLDTLQYGFKQRFTDRIFFNSTATPNIQSFVAYNVWRTPQLPPRIDSNKFSQESEIRFYPTSGTPPLSAVNPILTTSTFEMQGVYGPQKSSRYQDIANSYSFTPEGSPVIAPTNVILELKDNTKTRNITSFSITADGLVTINTTTNHPYLIGSGVRIAGIGGVYRYALSGTFKIISTPSPTSFTFQTRNYGPGYVSSSVCPVAPLGTLDCDINLGQSQVNYYNVISGIAPSSAVGINYIGTPPIVTDHTIFTKLIYPLKSTFILSNQGIPSTSNNSSAATALLMNWAGIVSKTIWQYPISQLSGLIGPFVGEYNSFLYNATSATDTYVRPLNNDTWDANLNWNPINSYILSSPLLAAHHTGSDYINSDYCYWKYPFTSSVIQSWITGAVSSFAVTLETINITQFTVVTDDTYTTSKSGASISPSELQQLPPYLVIAGSGVIQSDSIPPSLSTSRAINTFLILDILGNGSGVINVTLSESISINNPLSITVWGTGLYDVTNVTANQISDTQLSYAISGNTLTTNINNGYLITMEDAKVSMQAVDESSISINDADISITRDLIPTNLTPYDINRPTTTLMTYNFNLDGIGDGIWDSKVKDTTGNTSNIIDSAILMYSSSAVGLGYAPFVKNVRFSDGVWVRGFNVNDFISQMQVTVNDFANGGVNQTATPIPITIFDGANESFFIPLPTTVGVEYDASINNLGIVNVIGAPLFQLGTRLVFNSIGPIQESLKVGMVYYVINVVNGGSGSVNVTLSKSLGGVAIPFVVGSGNIFLKAYNATFPIRLSRDGVDTISYSNLTWSWIDNYGPLISISSIPAYNSIVTIYVSDPFGINLSDITFSSGTVLTTLNVNGDGTVWMFTIQMTISGSFRVNATDITGWSVFSDAIVPNQPGPAPTISVVSTTINGPTSFTMVLKVQDDNTPAVLAPDNTSPGYFVQGSVNNFVFGVSSPVGTIIPSTTDFTFVLTSTTLSPGIFRVFATDNDGNTTSITPPIITNISPQCQKTGNIIYVNGMNLNWSNGTQRSFGVLFSINESTATQALLSATVMNSTEGYRNISLIEQIGNQSFTTNTLQILVDNTAPVINVIGSIIVEVNIGSGVYNDLGATASDAITGDLTSSIISTGINLVNTNIQGDYPIEYSVSDSCGNIATASRLVRVISPCIIRITATPLVGSPGDSIVITAVEGSFDTILSNNIVTFNGIKATIVSGDIYTLVVSVPQGNSSGNIIVNNITSQCGFSNSVVFKSIYSDEIFMTTTEAVSKSKRYLASTQERTLFDPGPQKNPVYNKDLSYSHPTLIVDENTMIQNVFTLILTNKGERLFNFEYGSDVQKQVFNLMGNGEEDFSKQILNIISNAILVYEPRVSLILDRSYAEWDGYNAINILLALSVPSGVVKYISITLDQMKISANIRN